MSKKGKIKLDIGTRSFYMDGVKRSGGYIPVSYTHLTLPTT